MYEWTLAMGLAAEHSGLPLDPDVEAAAVGLEKAG
jgi:hypothetical protein